MQWQIIVLLHSLILVPALTLHSHTFTLCEGHASQKVKVMLDTNFMSSPSMCRAAVWFTSIFSVTGIGYSLSMLKTRKLNTTGQKLMAQELKDGRMMRTYILPAVPEHFTPKTPTEPPHPLLRGRPVAFPFTFSGKDSKPALPKLVHAMHQNVLGFLYL